MTIVATQSPAPRPTWSALLADTPLAVPGQSPEWLDAVCAAGRYSDASIEYKIDDGRTFVLPLVRKYGRYGPHTGFSSGWGIGGLVGPDLDGQVITDVLAERRDARVLYTHLRPNPLTGDLWSGADLTGVTAVQRRAHVISLDGGLTEVEARMRKSARRGVKAASRSGVTVEVHLGGEELERYYEQLYLPALAIWATRQSEPERLTRLRARKSDPLSKLQGLAASLGSAFRLYLASFEGRAAAGNIVLWGPNAHATRGAVNRSWAARSNAGYAAEWAALSDACDAGLSWYHLGESGNNKSLSEYKERFGAIAYDYQEVRVERLPLLQIDRQLRETVKKVIGFEEAS